MSRIFGNIFDIPDSIGYGLGMSTHADFIREVESRAETVGKTPGVVLVLADFSPRTWDNWSAGKTSPTAEAMDAVRAVLKRLERSAK